MSTTAGTKSTVSSPAIFAEDDIIIRTSNRLADLGSLVVNFESGDYTTLASLHMSPKAVLSLIDALLAMPVSA